MLAPGREGCRDTSPSDSCPRGCWLGPWSHLLTRGSESSRLHWPGTLAKPPVCPRAVGQAQAKLHSRRESQRHREHAGSLSPKAEGTAAWRPPEVFPGGPGQATCPGSSTSTPVVEVNSSRIVPLCWGWGAPPEGPIGLLTSLVEGIPPPPPRLACRKSHCTSSRVLWVPSSMITKSMNSCTGRRRWRPLRGSDGRDRFSGTISKLKC